jgi:diguanylate cyclase (GGDEF)-like protein/PAS domain S-box-containing protein
MDIEGKPKSNLAAELEALRDEIAQLHSRVFCPSPELFPTEIPEQALQEEKFIPPDLLEDGPVGMALVDTQYRIVKANRMLCRMLDYAETEIQLLQIQKITQDPTGLPRLIQQVFDAVLPVLKTEGILLKKSGETIWTHLAISEAPKRYADLKCCLIIVEDINDRKSAEQALKTEKQLLEWLINSSVDGIVAFDRDGFFTVWNPGMERIFGVSARETLGRPAFLACPFLKELGEDVNFAEALTGNKVISRDKCYTIPGASKPAYFEGYYGPMRNPSDGKVIGGLAIIRDVTEHRLAEEGKRISEERYRELFENAYDMVYTHDLAGNITSINKAAERVLGYSRAEALQLRFGQLVAPEFKQAARRMIDRQIANEAPTTQELEVIAKDGSRVTLEVSNRLVFREGKPFGIQGIARDISERKKSEDALQTANKKLEAWVQELEQRNREMAMLSEMGDILRACLTTEEVYEVIVRVSQDIFPVQGGALFVMAPLRNMVESVAEWGDSSQMESTFTPDACWALRRGRVHWVEDTRVGLLCKHLQSPSPRGYLCVPMMAQSEAVGVLHLTYSEESHMPVAKQRLAMAMAERVAMALSNLRLHESLRNQSIRDQLTELFNRSFMEESLELELRRSLRTQASLSVIMIVLDDFQGINESSGLDAGDSILRRTAMLIQANVRKGDVACRFSGHAFVVVLPHTSYDVSLQRAETFCNLIRTLDFKYQNDRECRVTASVGLAIFPDHGQTVEALLSSAEAAVCRARNDGGDCVVGAN